MGLNVKELIWSKDLFDPQLVGLKAKDPTQTRANLDVLTKHVFLAASHIKFSSKIDYDRAADAI